MMDEDEVVIDEMRWREGDGIKAGKIVKRKREGEDGRGRVQTLRLGSNFKQVWLSKGVLVG